VNRARSANLEHPADLLVTNDLGDYHSIVTDLNVKGYRFFSQIAELRHRWQYYITEVSRLDKRAAKQN
jgi:hypothetical protein